MTKTRYSAVAVALHWLVAIGIIYNLVAMLVVDDDARSRAFIDLHKSIGITVLGLVLLRILWRLGHTPPAPMPTLKPWERKLSLGVHHLLYLLMVLAPLSGWLMNSASFNKATGQPYDIDLFHVLPWFNLPFFGTMSAAARAHWHDGLGAAHGLLFKLLLWAALLLHVAGALKHQLRDRQKALQRMWFGRAHPDQGAG